MFIVRYDRDQDCTTLVLRRRGINNVCGEGIDEIGLESRDAVVECIKTHTDDRDLALPQRGDQRLYQLVHDQQGGFANPAYVCIGDGVSCGILEPMPVGG